MKCQILFSGKIRKMTLICYLLIMPRKWYIFYFYFFFFCTGLHVKVNLTKTVIFYDFTFT